MTPTDTGPVLTFLSDYGYRDEFVGVCHGVIAQRCPQARVIDVTHGVPRHNIRVGALTLASVLTFMPVGVHLAVVDPEVGSSGHDARRAVALRTALEGRVLVGPDNGLLALACEQLGGVIEAVDIGRSRERLEPVSTTFQGRDIFAPVAAALAGGEALAAVGEPLAVEELRQLELPTARAQQGGLLAHVLHVDHFGNLTLDATHAQLTETGVRLGTALSVKGPTDTRGGRYVSTFADVPAGELLLYEDARRMAALAINRGSAAAVLGAGLDDELLLTPA